MGKVQGKFSNFVTKLKKIAMHSHRIIVTKRELYFYGYSHDQAYFFCVETTCSVCHTFVECLISKQFYCHVVDRINEENATSLSLSPTLFEILFGKLKSGQTCKAKLRKLNYSLLLAKYYIYYQKMNEKELNFCEFKQRCIFTRNIEDIA